MNNLKNSKGPLLGHLDELETICLERDPTLKDIFNVFGADGHYVVILFLVIPFLQPLPLFGLSTIFGILIAIVAAFAFASKPPWLPKRWASKTISASTVSRISEGSERIFKKLSFMLYPRWNVLFSSPFRIVSAILLIANAILLALPLPIPFSNAIPAWMIFFQALAHLEEDGLFVVLSYIQTAFCLVYFFALTEGVLAGVNFLGF